MTIELTLLSGISFQGREITGARLQGLLALLADDLPHGCGTGRLIDGLWPDSRPEHPVKALQVLISRARTRLGADVIAGTPTGYRLALSAEQVDSSAVLLAEKACVRDAKSGDHAAVLAHSETALALWGPGPSTPLREAREPVRRALVRHRALALGRLGRRTEAVALLAEVHAAEPADDEVLLELLRSEPPAAALDRYEAHRRDLRDRLGADPGPELQALHRELLHHDTPAVRHGVAHEPNTLLGRDADVTAVLELLRTSRVVTVLGPGGLGKTRLANAVARQADQRVVYFVQLAGVIYDEDVTTEVVSAIGTGDPRRAAADPFLAMVQALDAGPALLVLDNCEHLLDGAVALAQRLVSATRDLRILATSRAPLGISSESVYPLPELDTATAVELFTVRARAARPGVELPADGLAALCRQLDGLPLAVELAAARVRVMSVTEIAGRLDDRFSLLRGGARDTPERHRTLHAVVDWSWNLLEPRGRAALRVLSVFLGGFTADAAAYLGVDLDLLEDLVAQSLLKVSDTPFGARFRMLETVLEFALAQEQTISERVRMVDGLLEWAEEFGLANHEAPFAEDPFSSCERIAREQDNLVHALRFALGRGRVSTAVACGAVLAALWSAENNFSRVLTLTAETGYLLSHYRPAPEYVEVARSLSALCVLTVFSVHGPLAVRPLVTLRRLPEAPPDTVARAAAAILTSDQDLASLADSDAPLLSGIAGAILAYAREAADGPEAALPAARRSLAAFARAGNPWMRIVASARLSELCLAAGEGGEALGHLLAARRLQSQLGDRADQIGVQWGLVLGHLRLGDVEEAERRLGSMPQETRDAAGIYTPDLVVRAEVALARGEVDTGLGLWRRAVARVRGAAAPGTDPYLGPWLVELQAAAVTTHVRHGRPEAVARDAAELPGKLLGLLQAPDSGLPATLMAMPVCGAVLLALAAVDLHEGRDPESGARLTALAERFRYQPTVSAVRAGPNASQTVGPAYTAAVAEYAGLDRAGLRAAAVALVTARERGRTAS